MIALIGWTFAATFFAAWVIVAIGGQQQRAELIKQRDAERNRANDLVLECALFELGRDIALEQRDQARRLVHPSTRPAPVADVIPFPRGGAS